MYIFLYGADIFRSQEKLSALKNKYLEKNSSGTSLSILDYAENLPIQSLKDNLAAQGLFSTKRLVIISNIFTNSTEKQKEVLAILQSRKELENDPDTIVIFFERANPKKSTALYKFLVKVSKKQEFAPLDGAKLSEWVLSYTKKLNPEVSFSKTALDMLISFVGSDLYLLSNELQKVINYKNSGEILLADIELLIKSKIDSTMFEAIEALTSGNKPRALALLHEQLAKGEDIYYILSMYTYQVRTLLKIGDFYWQGMMSAPQISQASGIHPYVVQK